MFGHSGRFVFSFLLFFRIFLGGGNSSGHCGGHFITFYKECRGGVDIISERKKGREKLEVGG